MNKTAFCLLFNSYAGHLLERTTMGHTVRNCEDVRGCIAGERKPAEPEAVRVFGESLGGEEEDRTPDLRIANATLSQLSYPPNVF